MRALLYLVMVHVVIFNTSLRGAAVEVDLSRTDGDSQVTVNRKNQDELELLWPAGDGEWGRLGLSLQPGRNLIRYLALSDQRDQRGVSLLEDVNPLTVVTVGHRDLSKRNGWVIFFDKVHTRPYKTYRATLEMSRVRVATKAGRGSVSIANLAAGPFRGELVLTVYAGCRLVHVEAVLGTSEDGMALVYDAGLSATSPTWDRVSWMDTTGQMHHQEDDPRQPAQAVAVRHRTIVAESKAGSVAIFPPPHQFFYPLDFSDNLKFVWHGTGFRDVVPQPALGIRQELAGDRRFVPWFNAPPGTLQRLGVFYLLSRGPAEEVMRHVKRYTNGDRFRKLPGYRTFTSHFHVEHTTDLLNRQPEEFTGKPADIRIPPELQTPGFVRVFRDMGVDIAHLAEFHFGRTPRLEPSHRLPLLETMHQECERLSDENFLLLPGEEPNVHLGGHWISLFPKPVYWVLNRGPDIPFARQHPKYGTVYHVGSTDDVLRLLREEGGLAWTAHPRIKSSTGYPDRYRKQDFYLSDRFLGGAWKAMPADLSMPRLGRRVLDLLDDMANWGQQKYVLGEVDVFKINPDHEQYAHMNINYLRLEKVPRFSDGWQPVLDALRGGKFFVSTGEVLLPRFTVGGRQSGQIVDLSGGTRPEIEVDITWTFPLKFAEVVSGDGQAVHRHRIDLTDTASFGSQTLRWNQDLTGRSWVRVEVWDIAANGAFTQPVWLRNSN